MMRPRFPQADGRALAPRKWSALKTGGPLVHFCELVLKKMIQVGFAASYRIVGNRQEWARFDSELPVTDEFLLALDRCCRIIARRCRCVAEACGQLVMLVAEWVLRFRYGKRHGKPVAVQFVQIAPEPWAIT